MRGLYVVPLVLVMLLLAAVPACAGAPWVASGPWVWDEDLPYCTFPVHIHTEGVYQEQVFFNAQGEWIKWRFHWVGTDYVTAPGTSDIVLTGQTSFTEEVDAATSLFTPRGVLHSITIPGHGAVFFEAGHFVGVLGEPGGRLVGHHTAGDPEKMAVLCAALAGE